MTVVDVGQTKLKQSRDKGILAEATKIEDASMGVCKHIEGEDIGSEELNQNLFQDDEQIS